MSASLPEPKAKKAAVIIEKVLEPKIKKILEETNKLLDKDGIVIGCDIQWFIDKKEGTNETPKKD